jgi:hypothetical protein
MRVSRRSSFAQSDVTRALKAAKAAGIPVKRIEIETTGKIVVVTEQERGNAADRSDENEWDSVK